MTNSKFVELVSLLVWAPVAVVCLGVKWMDRKKKDKSPPKLKVNYQPDYKPGYDSGHSIGSSH